MAFIRFPASIKVAAACQHLLLGTNGTHGISADHSEFTISSSVLHQGYFWRKAALSKSCQTASTSGNGRSLFRNGSHLTVSAGKRRAPHRPTQA